MLFAWGQDKATSSQRCDLRRLIQGPVQAWERAEFAAKSLLYDLTALRVVLRGPHAQTAARLEHLGWRYTCL